MITISPKRIAVWLILIAVGLVLASLAGSFSTHVLGHPRLLGFVRLFNVDTEGNIPSWYASICLLAGSILLAAIARLQPRDATPKASDWQTLSIIFLFLSIDELSSIHELLIDPLRAVLGTTGIFHFAWVIPYGLLATFLGLKYLKFLACLPARIRRSLVVAGLLYLSGALGMEMADGQYASLYGEQNLTYAVLTTIEESLEMLGLIVFVYTLLAYVRRYIKVIQISFSNNPLEALPEMTQQRSHV